MAAASTPERVLMRLRRVAWRLSGPLARRRSGYFFIWTRAILAVLERVARRGPGVVGIDSVGLDVLSAPATGARYRELEPAADDVIPPLGWEWPSRSPAAARLDPTSTRGHGVMEIPGGIVCGTRGQIGLDPSGVLVDACAPARNETREVLADARATLAIGVEELDGVTMSLWAGQSNYAHCLLQSVPRLHLLKQGFGFEADRYLLRDSAPRPAIEALAVLGIPDERVQIVPWHDAPAYRCEMLRAATTPLINEFGVPWAAAFLHELFLPAPARTQSRRIYVRRGISRRVVLNEDAVLALLEPAGFEAVTMDGRSIGEQAAMFASAEVVVATHGAALANLVFASPGTVVIELMGRNTVSDLYAFLAWRRDLRYHLIMGTEPAPPERWWTWQFRADTIVDLRELRNRLERLHLL